jgi:hypothetical protein
VREGEELRETKGLCDRYYDNPPIALNEITTGRLHSLSFIDVDAGTVRDVDPETYAESLLGMWNKIRQ